MPGYISIIVPAFQAEASITRCLESIERMSDVVKEIIVVDDCSLDATRDCVDSYKKNNHVLNVIYVRNPKNHGPSRSRNIGIALATGSHLMFVDSDDIIMRLPSYFALDLAKAHLFTTTYHYQAKKLGTKRESLVLNAGGSIKDKDYIRRGSTLDNFISDYLERPRQNCLLEHCWGKLYSLRFIQEKNIFFDEGMNQLEDVLFNLRVLCETKSVLVLTIPLYVHILDSSESRLSLRVGSEARTVDDVSRCSELALRLINRSGDTRLSNAYRASKLSSYLIRLIERKEFFAFAANIYRLYREEELWEFVVLAGDESSIVQLLMFSGISLTFLRQYILMRRQILKLIPRVVALCASRSSRKVLLSIQKARLLECYQILR